MKEKYNNKLWVDLRTRLYKVSVMNKHFNSSTLAGNLGILFIILKLTHVINWSWWWVTIPLSINLIFFIIVIIIVSTVVIIKHVWVYLSRKNID